MKKQMPSMNESRIGRRIWTHRSERRTASSEGAVKWGRCDEHGGGGDEESFGTRGWAGEEAGLLGWAVRREMGPLVLGRPFF